MLAKNFSYSIVYKILALLISLTLVPLLIDILGVEEYGLWVTFTSLLVWISLFDFGLGYALKNTVSKSLANSAIKNAQQETFQILKITFFFAFVLLVVFAFSFLFIEIFSNNIYLSLILFIPFILTFPIKLGSPILQGARKIALESGLLFLNTLLFFISILIIKFFNLKLEIVDLAILFVMSYILSTFLVWLSAMRIIEITWIDFKKISSTKLDFIRIQMGIKFFGLQLSSLVLYSIGTIIVFSNLNAISAAHFDVVNKIFLAGLGIFNIGIAVFWPEISHSLEKKDFHRILKLYLIMIGLSIIFLICSIIFSFFAPQIIALWTNNKINVSQQETIWFALLVSIQATAYCGAVVLNAFEKITYQLLISIIATILMLPLSIYLIDSNYSISSVPIASFILTIPATLYCNVHAYRLIKKGILDVKTNYK